MADRAHARLHQVHALVGLPGREHVLPDRIARRGVPEADLAAVLEGAQAAQELERVGSDRLARPARRRRGAGREVGDVDLAGHHEVVVAGQAQIAALACELDAVVRLGAVADQVAETPDLVHADLRRRRRARPRRRAGCRARRRAGRCAFRCLLQCPRNGNPWAFAAAAGDPGGGRRRWRGHVPAPPAQRPDRPGRGRRGRVLHSLSAGAGGGLSRRPAPARHRRPGGGHGHAGAS